MHYIDASAFVKLIVEEKETQALLKSLPPSLISGEILTVEVMRTTVHSDAETIAFARKLLAGINFMPISSEVISIASLFGAHIKSKTLDAIHLAAALSIGSAIDGIITYDKMMIADAKLLGIPVLSPA
jgi:uncharacterized protein